MRNLSMLTSGAVAAVAFAGSAMGSQSWAVDRYAPQVFDVVGAERDEHGAAEDSESGRTVGAEPDRVVLNQCSVGGFISDEDAAVGDHVSLSRRGSADRRIRAATEYIDAVLADRSQ